MCPGCNEATLTCGVVQKQGNEWKEALALRIDSSAGNTARLSTPH